MKKIIQKVTILILATALSGAVIWHVGGQDDEGSLGRISTTISE
ncbi:hypothetical protein [Schleiferilactobacillus harbinensis]|uniref:Uncharacterized protein n=1 Tax=Schleiferilactobacillus harbinensis TaxID=304207 RepID=A0ABU7T1V6_9LACO